MKAKTFVLFALAVIAVPALIWAGGNHTTAGYTHNRTYLHSQAGDLRPPLMMSRSLALPGVGSAESLLVFDFAGSQKLLVGENDGASAIYTQIDAAAETMDWQMMIPGAPESDLNYVPAYAHGVVVLGGPATTTVYGVNVETGDALWGDMSVGAARGRFPINTAGAAFYAGEYARCSG